MSFNIDQALTDDIPQLVQLEKNCFLTDRLSATQFKYLIKSNNEILVVKQRQRIIAYGIILFRKNSSIARLYSLAVHAKYRRHGIAQKLNDAISQHAQQRACTQIRLEVRKDNDAAIRFYKKNGYKIFAEYKKFYEDKTDAWRMQFTL